VAINYMGTIYFWADGVTCPSCKAKENITTRKRKKAAKRA